MKGQLVVHAGTDLYICTTYLPTSIGSQTIKLTISNNLYKYMEKIMAQNPRDLSKYQRPLCYIHIHTSLHQSVITTLLQ
jgi:hypothetical protein